MNLEDKSSRVQAGFDHYSVDRGDKIHVVGEGEAVILAVPTRKTTTVETDQNTSESSIITYLLIDNGDNIDQSDVRDHLLFNQAGHSLKIHNKQSEVDDSSDESGIYVLTIGTGIQVKSDRAGKLLTLTESNYNRILEATNKIVSDNQTIDGVTREGSNYFIIQDGLIITYTLNTTTKILRLLKVEKIVEDQTAVENPDERNSPLFKIYDIEPSKNYAEKLWNQLMTKLKGLQEKQGADSTNRILFPLFSSMFKKVARAFQRAEDEKDARLSDGEGTGDNKIPVNIRIARVIKGFITNTLGRFRNRQEDSDTQETQWVQPGREQISFEEPTQFTAAYQETQDKFS